MPDRDCRFGARPVNDLIHRAGFWMLMLLFISLAVTPLRRITRFGQLVDIRRMIGVGAFCYGACTSGLYMVDQMFDLGHVATRSSTGLSAIGFTALTGLAALAATSTDGMVRPLGGLRWQRLHQIVYVVAVLALDPFLPADQADVILPTLVAGLLAWLMGYPDRLARCIRGELSSGRCSFSAWRFGFDLRASDRCRPRLQCVAARGAADGVQLRPRQSRYGAAGLVRAGGWIGCGGDRFRMRPLAHAAAAQAGARAHARGARARDSVTSDLGNVLEQSPGARKNPPHLFDVAANFIRAAGCVYLA